ncbi:MAG: two-component system response regulator [Firmicutes bacterium]|nr:two-component system response regulator [Bacillota bacterium]
MQVLVLDDSDVMRDIVVKSLLELGLEVKHLDQVSTGSDAIKQLKEKTYDLFFLDIVMDGIDGIAVLKEVKALQPKAKVIMCSTFSKSETVKNLIDIGINDFVVKPFDVNRLKEAVLRQFPDIRVNS